MNTEHTRYIANVFIIAIMAISLVIIGISIISGNVFIIRLEMDENFKEAVNSANNVSCDCHPVTIDEYYNSGCERKNDDIWFDSENKWVHDFHTDKPILMVNGKIQR